MEPATLPALQSTKDPHTSKPKQRLDLSYSNLTSLPPDLSRFHHIHTLTLCNNALDSFDWRPLMAITPLTNVDLSHNRISELPVYLAGWDTVRRLDLSHNVIVHVPSALWPLFFDAVYAYPLTRKGEIEEHSEESTRFVESKYGANVPEVIQWVRPNGPGGFPIGFPVCVHAKQWLYHPLRRLGSGGRLPIRIILEGNDRLEEPALNDAVACWAPVWRWREAANAHYPWTQNAEAREHPQPWRH